MSFIENLYLKGMLQEVKEKNLNLRNLINEYSSETLANYFPLASSSVYAERLKEIEKTPRPLYPGENAPPSQIEKWKKDTEKWAFNQRKLGAAMERSTTSNIHPVAQPFHDTQVAMAQTVAIDKRREAAKKESYPGQHPVRK